MRLRHNLRFRAGFPAQCTLSPCDEKGIRDSKSGERVNADGSSNDASGGRTEALGLDVRPNNGRTG